MKRWLGRGEDGVKGTWLDKIYWYWARSALDIYCTVAYDDAVGQRKITVKIT